MLFQLSKQHYPNAMQTSVMPKEHVGIALRGHTVYATIDESCTLIHQTIEKKEYSLWVNNFIIHKPMLLQTIPEQPMYALYYSMENSVKLLIGKDIKTIAPREFCQFEFPPGTHYGVFSKGVYRALHIITSNDNRSIIQDQQNAAALLREYYSDVAFQHH